MSSRPSAGGRSSAGSRGGYEEPAVDLTGWTPVRARPRDGELAVEWRWLDNAPFREPFFADTVQLALERPFTLLFPRETTIDATAELRYLPKGVRVGDRRAAFRVIATTPIPARSPG